MVKIFSFLLLIIIIYSNFICARNPFLFSNEEQRMDRSVNELELRGISVCQETGTMLAMIMHKRELFTVQTGEYIEQWRIKKIDREYAILINTNGNEKRLDLQESH